MPERGANYTGLFYKENLKSKSTNDNRLAFGDVSKYFHPKGGPTLLKTDLQLGDIKPKNALALSTEIVKHILLAN